MRTLIILICGSAFALSSLAVERAHAALPEFEIVDLQIDDMEDLFHQAAKAVCFEEITSATLSAKFDGLPTCEFYIAESPEAFTRVDGVLQIISISMYLDKTLWLQNLGKQKSLSFGQRPNGG